MDKMSTELAAARNNAGKNSKFGAETARIGADLAAEYPEFEDIQKDWNALKKDVYELTSHVRANGGEKLNKLSHDSLEKVSRHIKEKPAQTLMIAFAGGIIASILFGRR